MTEDLGSNQNVIPAESPYAIPGKDTELIKWEESYKEELESLQEILEGHFNDAGYKTLIREAKSRASKQVSLSYFSYDQIRLIMIIIEQDLGQMIAVGVQEWDYDMTDFQQIVHAMGNFIFAVYQKAYNGEGRKIHSSQYSTITTQNISQEEKKGLLRR